MPDEILDVAHGLPCPALTWMPIETAPQDGTHILAWDGNLPGHHFCNHPPTVVHWFEDGFYTSVNELAPELPYAAVVWAELHEKPAQEAALAASEESPARRGEEA